MLVLEKNLLRRGYWDKIPENPRRKRAEMLSEVFSTIPARRDQTFLKGIALAKPLKEDMY